MVEQNTCSSGSNETNTGRAMTDLSCSVRFKIIAWWQGIVEVRNETSKGAEARARAGAGAEGFAV